MTYTKGEWKVSPVDFHVFIPNHGAIADCYKHEANAHLISAAPELYEALKGAEESIKIEWLYQTGQFSRPQSNYPPQGSVHGSLMNVMEIITKALAKAERVK